MKKLIFLLLTMFALASYSQALKQKSLPELERDLKKIDEPLENLVTLVNLYKRPLSDELLHYFNSVKKAHRTNTFKVIKNELEDFDGNLNELLKNKKYEEV